MYGSHGENNDLVVLSHDTNPEGYGIGPKGNDPTRKHSSREGWLYYPASYVTPKEESKAVTKFNKGDKVRFIDKSNTAWFGVEAIVEQPGGSHSSNILRLTKAATGWASHFTVGSEARISNQYLELVEDTFTFKDIQKGDTIRRTLLNKGGSTEVREGVVGHKGSWYWATKDNQYILAYADDDTNKAVTLELVDRPEPEPTLLEGTKAGDQLVLKLYNGATKVHTRNAKGTWDTIVFRNGEYSHVGFVWDTSDLEGEAVQAKSHKLLKV